MDGGGQAWSAAEALRVLGPQAAGGARGLQAAFRAAVKATHPDAPGGDAAAFRGVVAAHATLKTLRAGREADPGPSAAVPALDISPAQAACGGTHLVRTPDGRRLQATLPMGLRAGMTVRLAGRPRRVAIVGENGASVAGDDVRLSVQAPRALMRCGGWLAVETPTGPRVVRLPAREGAACVVRVAGAGLPPAFGRSRGDLLVHVRCSDGRRGAAPARGRAEFPLGLAA